MARKKVSRAPLSPDMIAEGLTEGERALAEALADPFRPGDDIAGLYTTLGMDTADYYAALKKELFTGYMEHLQGQVHKDLVRVTFTRSVQRGVAGGSLQHLKLWAEMNGLVKKPKNGKDEAPMEDAEIEKALAEFEAQTAVLLGKG